MGLVEVQGQVLALIVVTCSQDHQIATILSFVAPGSRNGHNC